MDIQQRVKQFIIQNFYISDVTALTNDSSLITTGVVDSTGMLEVIAFLEEEYKFTIEDAEMIPANLETIDQIAAFVNNKQSAVVR